MNLWILTFRIPIFTLQFTPSQEVPLIYGQPRLLPVLSAPFQPLLCTKGILKCHGSRGCSSMSFRHNYLPLSRWLATQGPIPMRRFYWQYQWQGPPDQSWKDHFDPGSTDCIGASLDVVTDIDRFVNLQNLIAKISAIFMHRASLWPSMPDYISSVSRDGSGQSKDQ